MAAQDLRSGYVKVMRKVSSSIAIRGSCLLLAGTLAGCGLKGPLYLPEQASEIVTRPTQTPPPETTTAPGSGQTIDSPAGGDTPAPEVTAPESAEKKDKDGATPKPR
jgi:predicted small lipoprotein YifL